ncbi:MAG TPA: hypothetical protein VK568_08785 [Thermodesulfobacteriota bacterium]|jgi:hypothetical protein|nr:hypothetical protein [Thermodesulfobacteriota bacterium]
MKQDDQSKTDDQKPVGLTIYNPEDQVFQKLHLCEYMRELYEGAEKENGHWAEKRKDFQRHLCKDRG